MSEKLVKQFTTDDVAEYYDKTEIHYKRAWDLEASMALHYGFWRKDTKSFRESLQHMNDEMAKTAKITSDDYMLDAGCGVGGSSIFVAKHIGARAKGITLSQQQVERAYQNAEKHQVSSLLEFECKDYTNTGFADNTFDVVWGLESVATAQQKEAFAKEAFRILKPGGRLIIGDCFQRKAELTVKEHKLMQKWLNAWAISGLETEKEFTNILSQQGFQSINFRNITENVRHSAWRIFYGSFFMTVLSGLYRLYNPKVSYFADNHYKALFYQYIALRKNLWDYCIVYAEKKS
ncbi:MAG: SAM-dependent methyltransferase [Flammeovirgaceae bacterium]